MAHTGGTAPFGDPQNLGLCPGASRNFQTPDDLSTATYWAKMRCNRHGQQCELGEGDSPGQDTKFTASFGSSGRDRVDLSLIDGWTLPFKLETSLQCNSSEKERKVAQVIDCSGITLDACPSAEDIGLANNTTVDLKVLHPKTGVAVGCYSPCSKLTSSNWGSKALPQQVRQYCCPTTETASSCRAGPVKDTKFVQAVHDKCPGVRSYPHGDGVGPLSCPKETVYTLTFYCPGGKAVNRSHKECHAADNMFEVSGLFDCTARPFAAWSIRKKAFCCQQEGVCAEAALGRFDCTIYMEDLEKMWPPKHLAWCCKQERRGCALLEASTTTTGPWMTTTPHHLPKHDCQFGYPEWVPQWSADKRAWCCRRARRGCGSSTSSSARSSSSTRGNGSIQGSSRTSISTATTSASAMTTTTIPTTVAHIETSTAFRPATSTSSTSTSTLRRVVEVVYNCATNQESWQWQWLPILGGGSATWSAEQKAWCCHTAGVGCTTTETDMTADRAGASSTLMASTTSVPSTAGATTATPTTSLLSIAMGFTTTISTALPVRASATREATTPTPTTSPLSTSRGLATTIPTVLPVRASATKEGFYDCTGTPPEPRWDSEHAAWCCRNEGVHCSDEYDCRVDYWDWLSAWTVQKKAWCCKQVGRGCANDVWRTAMPSRFARPPTGWQAPRRPAKAAAAAVERAAILASFAAVAVLAVGALRRRALQRSVRSGEGIYTASATLTLASEGNVVE